MTKRKNKVKLKTMDIVLIVIGILLVCFITVMIFLFRRFNSVPDSLIYSTFGLFTGECGVMGWIKNEKTKSESNFREKE